MDQHYDTCEKHNAQWHTVTNGSMCPFCRIEAIKEKISEIRVTLPKNDFEYGSNYILDQLSEILK